MIRNITTLLIICLFATSVHAAQMSVDPSYMGVVKGENFTVDITIDPDGSEVYGASYYLYFNNTLLNATLQTKGSFLSQDGAITNLLKNEINNTIGRIKYGEARTGDYGISTPGILATITFQAIAEEDGISELRLENVKLSDPLANFIQTNVSNGNVSVRLSICGDVNDDGSVDMTDVMTLWYDIADYPTPGAYTISNAWSADVNCDSGLDMTDVMTIWYDIADYPTPGAYEVNCCGG